MEGYQESVGFHWVDYLIFAASLFLSMAVGIFSSWSGNKTTEDYLTGSKKLHFIPVSLSIFMSVISGILVLGNSAEVYFYGTQLWMDCLARAAYYVISAILFVPLFYRMKLTSVFEVRMYFNIIMSSMAGKGQYRPREFT